MMVLPRSAAAGPTLEARSRAADEKTLTELRRTSVEAATAFEKGANASRAGENLAAFEAFAQAALLVPTSGPVVRRVGLAAFRLDRRDEGLKLVRKALEMDPGPENEVALAQLLFQTEDDLDGQEASGLAVKAADAAPEDPLMQGVCCVVTAKRGPRDALHRCTNRYLATAPDEAEAHFYGAVAALDRDDVPVARQKLARAKELGLPLAMAQLLQSRLDTLRPATPVVSKSVAALTRTFPLAYPLSLALLYVIRERLRGRLGGPLADPRAPPSMGDRFDRGALGTLLATFFALHFLLLPLVVAVLVAGVLLAVVGEPVSATKAALALLAATASALFLLRGVAVGAVSEEAVPLTDTLAEEVQRAAARVGTYPAEAMRRGEGAGVDVREETSLLGRQKGEALRTLVLDDAAGTWTRRDLRAALSHAHARLATATVTTAGAASLLGWLDRTTAQVPSALLARSARFLLAPVLRTAAARQATEADAQIAFLYGTDALDFTLGAQNVPSAERGSRLAAARALKIAPRVELDDDQESAADWFAKPA